MSSKEIKVDLSNSDFINKITSAILYLNIFKIQNDENPLVNTDDYSDVVVALSSFTYLSRDPAVDEENDTIELNQWIQANGQRVHDYWVAGHPQNGNQTPA